MFYFIVGQIHPHYVRWQVRWDANQICRQKKFRNIRPSTFMIPERQKFLLSSVHTKKKICEQRVWTFPALQLRQKCVCIFMASRWLAGCVQLFTFSRCSQRGHHVWQHFTYLPEGSLFCLHWRHHSHTLILVFEVSNALNSQSVLRIAISITEPLWSFELKSHTGGRFYKCSSCRDGGGEIKIWRCHYKTTENKRLKPVCSALTMNRFRFLWSQFTFWRFWIKAFTD